MDIYSAIRNNQIFTVIYCLVIGLVLSVVNTELNVGTELMFLIVSGTITFSFIVGIIMVVLIVGYNKYDYVIIKHYSPKTGLINYTVERVYQHFMGGPIWKEKLKFLDDSNDYTNSTNSSKTAIKGKERIIGFDTERKNKKINGRKTRHEIFKEE